MTMPTLIVRASEGYVADDEVTAGRIARMKNASMKTVSGVHHLHVEKPQEIAAAVRELFAM